MRDVRAALPLPCFHRKFFPECSSVAPWRQAVTFSDAGKSHSSHLRFLSTCCCVLKSTTGSRYHRGGELKHHRPQRQRISNHCYLKHAPYLSPASRAEIDLPFAIFSRLPRTALLSQPRAETHRIQCRNQNLRSHRHACFHDIPSLCAWTLDPRNDPPCCAESWMAFPAAAKLPIIETDALLKFHG